jgi:hypothetical protein
MSKVWQKFKETTPTAFGAPKTGFHAASTKLDGHTHNLYQTPARIKRKGNPTTSHECRPAQRT